MNRYHTEATHEATQNQAAVEAPDRKAQPEKQVSEESSREQAARSVMHPDGWDSDWRYYHGAMGG